MLRVRSGLLKLSPAVPFGRIDEMLNRMLSEPKRYDFKNKIGYSNRNSGTGLVEWKR